MVRCFLVVVIFLPSRETHVKMRNIWDKHDDILLVSFCLFVCFVALRPKSTAMVIAGRSVHLTTLFPGRLEQAVNQ